MQQLVIERAKRLFCSYGFKAVAMDDIAKESGISKKTLYQFFTDKSSLVGDVVKKLIKLYTTQLEGLASNSKNVVEEVFNEFQLYTSVLFSIQPVFFYELQKQFPDCWKQLDQLSDSICLPLIIQNLEKGIEQGYYRENLDVRATALIRASQIKLMVTRSFSDSITDNLLKQPSDINLFYLHAITNSKGKKAIDNYLKKENEQK